MTRTKKWECLGHTPDTMAFSRWSSMPLLKTPGSLPALPLLTIQRPSRIARDRSFLLGRSRERLTSNRPQRAPTTKENKMPHKFDLSASDPSTYTKTVHLSLWKNARDLRTLFELNKLFISGQLTIHPAHGIPALRGVGAPAGQPAGNERVRPLHLPRPAAHGSGRRRTQTRALPRRRACCCCCAGLVGCCWAAPEACARDAFKRHWPYTQFCVPVEQGGLTAVCATRLAQTLLEDERVHVVVSWPKGLELLYQGSEEGSFPWVPGDLEATRTYTPPDDLELLCHFRSRRGAVLSA